jgi:hypothetical protein
MTAGAGVVDDGTSRRCLSGYLLSHSSCCLIQDDAGVLATVQSVGGVVDGRRRSWGWLLLPSLILKPSLILSVKETPPVNPSTCIRCSPTCSTATSICPFFFSFFLFDHFLFVCLSFDSCKKEKTMENGPEFFWQLLEIIRANLFLFSSAPVNRTDTHAEKDFSVSFFRMLPDSFLYSSPAFMEGDFLRQFPFFFSSFSS